MTDHELITPTDDAGWRAYHDIRRRVLFEARGQFGIYQEDRPDERAPGNHPKLLLHRGDPIGVVRIDVDAATAIVRRVAIRADVQRLGHGRALISLVLEFARDKGCGQLASYVAPDAVGGMIIRSDTRQSTVEFASVAGQEHRGYFQVSASSESYSLTNARVFLENKSAFVKECEAFERSRKGKVVLTGTEDFQFSIEPDGGSGAIWVAVVLNKYFVAGGDRTGHAHSGKMSLEIGFSVAGEHVGTLVQEFRELLMSG